LSSADRPAGAVRALRLHVDAAPAAHDQSDDIRLRADFAARRPGLTAWRRPRPVPRSRKWSSPRCCSSWSPVIMGFGMKLLLGLNASFARALRDPRPWAM